MSQSNFFKCHTEEIGELIECLNDDVVAIEQYYFIIFLINKKKLD